MEKMKINLFIYLCLINFSCTHKISDINQIIESNDAGNYYLKEGKHNIKNTIKLPSNCTLIGNNTTLVFANSNTFPVFDITQKTNIKLKNITFRGEKLANTRKKEVYSKYRYQYLFSMIKSSDLSFERCNFNNSYGTVLYIEDCNEIYINECRFDTIGVCTESGGIYSYDGIFIGGYTSSKNINITNCKFNCIGSLYESCNKPWPNDGDGIHLQSPGEIKNVVIEN
ncbi:MAG: hypothetical protein RLZZ546_10, partial [Bacteroidota bacterium]